MHTLFEDPPSFESMKTLLDSRRPRLQLERDALAAKTDVLERCLLTGNEQPPSSEPSPSTSAGQPSKACTDEGQRTLPHIA